MIRQILQSGTQKKYRTNFQVAASRFRRQRLAMVGLVIVVFLLFVAIFAPLIAPTGYNEANFMAINEFPSREFPMGTDSIGRDYLSRNMYGIRTSLIVGFLAVILASIIGIPLGLAAGLRGGMTDFIVSAHGRNHDRLSRVCSLRSSLLPSSTAVCSAADFDNPVLKVVFVVGNHHLGRFVSTHAGPKF